LGSLFREVLIKCLEEIDLPLEEHQLSQCETYHDLLLTWNQKINLTAIEDAQEIAVKHFVDSLICAKYLDHPAQDTCIDVGTGAGFPGIPIKILLPEMRLTLLDSLAKRCQFLHTVVSSLALKETSVVHGRAEEKGKEPAFREQFFLATARAVSSLPVLAEYCLPFLRVGGIFFALKGPEVEEEVKKGAKAVAALGGKLREIKHYRLPSSGDRRSLVIMEKVSPTPAKYPRKPGMPEKKPLL